MSQLPYLLVLHASSMSHHRRHHLSHLCHRGSHLGLIGSHLELPVSFPRLRRIPRHKDVSFLRPRQIHVRRAPVRPQTALPTQDLGVVTLQQLMCLLHISLPRLHLQRTSLGSSPSRPFLLHSPIKPLTLTRTPCPMMRPCGTPLTVLIGWQQLRLKSALWNRKELGGKSPFLMPRLESSQVHGYFAASVALMALSRNSRLATACEVISKRETN